MAQKQVSVYQFKIQLKGTKPSIWRRIHLPENYTFYELHQAIINSIGWSGRHMHDFKMKNPETGFMETIGEDPDELNSCSSLDEKETKIKDFFINNKSKAFYVYDFEDSWIHDVKLEKILPAQSGQKYPKCVAGKRACPPEDCSGPEGYHYLLKKFEIPKNERSTDVNNENCHSSGTEQRYQMNDNFDPEAFDPHRVDFKIF